METAMINKFKRIVVPTDFSETAQVAVNLAGEMAGYYAARLDIVHAVDASVYAYAGYPFAALSKDLVSSAESGVQKVKLPSAAERAKVQRFVLSGSPASEVVDHAERHKADLVVIGTRGHGAVARFFLGSVADRVLHEAHCPVLLTKKPKGEIKHPKRKSKPFGRILFPTDFSDTANLALDRAVALAEDMDAQLFVMHVVDDSIITTHVPDEREIILRELRKAALKQIEKSLPPEHIDNFATTAVVKRGDPGKQIAAYAERQHCDLVVMGSHGRTGVKRALLGSVADRVVRLAKCSVFIERAKEA
jgi:nucleotide-binding universal stress UspA family protein